MVRVTFEESDIEPGDSFGVVKGRFVIRRSGIEINLCWKNLDCYADWLIRNAKHFPNPEESISLGESLKKQYT